MKVSVEVASVQYPGGLRGLGRVSFQLEPGELLLVVGPSGSGKSTLLKTVAGVIPFIEEAEASARLVVGGRDFSRLPPRERPVAYMPQDPRELVVGDTGLEILALYGGHPVIPVGDIVWKHVWEMSSGQLQRLVLSAVAGMGRRLLLLDEPLANLDVEASRESLETLRQLKREGLALVVAEHRVSRTWRLADKVLVLHRGSPVYYGDDVEEGLKTAEELGVRPASPRQPCQRRVGTPGALVARVEDVVAGYGGRPVLSSVTVECRGGSMVAVVGPNGSGKTTLLRVLAGLLKPSKGRVVYAWGRWDWRLIGYVPPDPWLSFTEKTVLEEVAATARRAGVRDPYTEAERVLDEVGLRGQLHRRPWELSGGEKLRLAVARMAVKKPRLMLLDEPFRGQDQYTAQRLLDLLSSLAAQGSCVVAVTHDLEFLGEFDTVWRVEAGGVRVWERR